MCERAAARESEEIARALDDPALPASALNGVFMHTFHRSGLAPEREAISRELITLSARHGFVNFVVLGSSGCRRSWPYSRRGAGRCARPRRVCPTRTPAARA
ncbi:hypothetical protein JWS13_25665 [Rhodococcus pseudokoreensis]|uniref:Uncharacterized protein n=1 Tax=Rhodococcus pseudokoreensis TaxID=2811421 RepID=A0A974ZVN5_9NOCA|nr:hypothetical protein [Rhodococcus pseudokoreensis]QSE91781.1 hypothetical protein JWS13_25665 [Rhodococcus pseudokoreensis]